MRRPSDKGALSICPAATRTHGARSIEYFAEHHATTKFLHIHYDSINQLQQMVARSHTNMKSMKHREDTDCAESVLLQTG